MDPKIIPNQKQTRTSADRLPGLANDRRQSRGAAGMVQNDAGLDEVLPDLPLGRECQGGYCELCPVALQIECENLVR